jgi:hypothetical protein
MTATTALFVSTSYTLEQLQNSVDTPFMPLVLTTGKAFVHIVSSISTLLLYLLPPMPLFILLLNFSAIHYQ